MKTKYVAWLPHIPICFPSSETTGYMSFLDLLHATNGRNLRLVRWLSLHESFKAQWWNQEIGRSLLRLCSGNQIFFRVSPSRYWKNTSKANRNPAGLARLSIFPSFLKPSLGKAELVNRKVIVLTTFTTLGFFSEFLPRPSSEKWVRSCNSEGHTCSCIRISYRVSPSLNTINRCNAIDISIKIT